MSNIKFDTNRINDIKPSSDNSRTNTPLSQNDIANFEKELQNKDNSNSKDSSEENSDKDSKSPNSPFENIFQNAFKTKENQITTPASVIQNTNANDIDNITEKLIERILVSDPKSGDQEIRIKLNDTILQDTEINIKRLFDGSLQIQLNSSNASSIQTLVAQQFELKKRLEQVENTQVSVEVNSENQEQNDTNQESRGLFDLYQYYQQNKG